MEKASGSTVPRRQLGRHLRELRGRARYSVKAAAEALEWSEAKLWRIETGQTSLRSHDAELMCRIYSAPAEMTDALMGLAKETKARGWWHAYGDVIPQGFDIYISLEEVASELAWYEGELVPGVLQTEDYARTVIRVFSPDEDPEEIERRVRLRITRQALLTRRAARPEFRMVIGEAALRRPVGGHDVMAAQLAHIIGAAALPNVMIRVMPLAADLHLGTMSGPFVILRFPLTGTGADTEPPIVYVDGYTGCLYLDKTREVEAFDNAFGSLWEQSLDERASLRLMSEMAGEHEHAQ